MKIPKTEYEIYYHPFNGTELIRLNLTKCEDERIKISNKVSINQPIEKYNPKSNYYNDICSKTTSENNTDITLNGTSIFPFGTPTSKLCEPISAIFPLIDTWASLSSEVTTILLFP